MSQVKVQNWKGTITYHANSVEVVEGVDDLIRIVKDPQRYPSPVRAKGSHHSTTRCIVAEHGTVVDMTKMNRILGIDREARTVTMQAAVLHIDAARELERHGLQFYVNVELGNLTVGSGACGGTKDASMFSSEDGAYEYGQVASYVVGMKAVLPDGETLTVTEADGELMEVMRSSYGMLGIIYEVTYKVKDIRPLAVEHVRYGVDEFADRLDELIAGNRSMMLYLFPFLDSVVVEYRSEGSGPIRSNSWQWRVRNWVWKAGSPAFGRLVTMLVPFQWLRSWILDNYNRISQWVMTHVIRSRNTSPADQIIRYSKTAGFGAYTFSIWAFPREEYPQTIRDYFRFCRDYHKEHGYRCNILNVGYHIAQDTRSLFSYTRGGSALTLDPVSTGSKGWNEFLDAYNNFSIQHNGKPLFNQTRGITRGQAQAAFGPEIAKFLKYRREYDPEGRFYTDYFRERFEESKGDSQSDSHELIEARAGMLFRALLEQTQDQVYFKDRQSRFVRVSNMVARKFGLRSVEEIYGKSDFDFFSIEHAQQAYDDEQRLMRDNTQLINEIEKETWPDGRVTWATSTKVPVRLESGEIAGMMGITRDITEQIEAQKEIEESRELLQKKNAIMETDLQSARTVQRLAIPGPLPRVAFAELAVSMASWGEVSGDLVTFPVQTEDHLSFILGDVSGHGVTAGLFTMLIKFLADDNVSEDGKQPDEALRMLDRHLEGLIPDGFLAACAGSLERRAGNVVRLTLANCCQPPLLYYNHKTGEVEIVEVRSESAIGLGVCRNLECKTFDLGPGDCVLLMTDGATECRDVEGREMGSEGLIEVFKRCARYPIDEVTQNLQEHLKAYSGGDFPQDDTTFLAIRST